MTGEVRPASTSQPDEDCARARPLRADALRNRRALLDAARTVFERDGVAAQMDDIAAGAGLGIGTLYRHFPTKEALIEMLIKERIDRLTASARAARQSEDAWQAVTELVWQLATFEAEDRGMVDILAGYDASSTGAGASMALLVDSLNSVVARAQAAGAMRRDVSAEDVLVAVCGIGKMMWPTDDGNQRWRRLVSVILDGLRVAQ